MGCLTFNKIQKQEALDGNKNETKSLVNDGLLRSNDILYIQRKLNRDAFELIYDRALGMIIGSAIGDSIGSYVEFSYNWISIDQLNDAMNMKGGGVHGISSGQVTDDTELSVCLTKSLIEMGNVFDINIIGKYYKEWYDSIPFDMGNCIQSTFKYAPNIDKMKSTAVEFNNNSDINGGNMSNGSLMRITPLIVYGYKLSDNELSRIIVDESSLSHYNKYVFICNTCYAIACRYLIIDYNELDRNINAYKLAKEYLRNNINNGNKEAKTVWEWLIVCEKMETKLLHKPTKQMGFIKIAFQRAFYNLLKSNNDGTGIYTNIKDSIKSTIFPGGDTDTNAAIVGGMVGAWQGFHSFPQFYIDKIKNCAPNKNRESYQAKKYLKEYSNLVFKLLQAAPDKLTYT